ncbi:hypothetical protein AC249_AIPGENE25568 [Exaiptasia diaphana]|nr:hypothetical protein AC249_AIPGENE25568 [Exaiptasia diaphana]
MRDSIRSPIPMRHEYSLKKYTYNLNVPTHLSLTITTMILLTLTSKYVIVVLTVIVAFLLFIEMDIWNSNSSVNLDVSLMNSSFDSKQTECLPGGLPDSLDKLRMLYDNVETFVMFIGYPRSSHSLVGSLLDAHPEIIIPHEYHIVNQWEIYRDEKIRNTGILKYLLFYNLHTLSTWQATFGNRAAKPIFVDDGINSYNVPDSWQGTFHEKIKIVEYKH